MGRQRTASRRAAVTKCARQQEYTTDLPQTLELVVSYCNDVQLLCKCSTVSSYFQALVTSSIKQRLPELLTHCVLRQQGWQDQKAPSRASAAEPVRWLCSTAGREAVGQEAVAQALLSPVMVVTRVCRKQPAGNCSKDERSVAGYSRAWAWEAVQKVLAASGLMLNDDLVAAAARQHLPSLRPLVEDLTAQVRGRFKAKAHTGLSAAHAYVILNDMDSLLKALRSVGPNTVRDLLFIAANEGNFSAWCALKMYDDQHSHLLTTGSPTLPGWTSGASQTRARRVRSSAGVSSSAAASSDEQPADGQQGAELMEQLLLTSLLADDDVGARWGLRSNVDRGVLLDMARHEAAKALDTSTVLKLMLVAAMRGDSTVSQPRGYGPGALTCLSNLPAAKDITTDEIVSILRTALHNSSCWTDSEGILGLPGALKMTSSQVCQLILMAVQQSKHHVTRSLSRSGRHCQLQREDVMHLLTTTLPELEADKFLTLLETLDGMQPHQCLTAEDVMQLLPQVARYRGCFTEHDIVTQAVDLLGFADKKVDTAERYVSFLQAMLTASWYECPDNVIEPLLEVHNRPDLRPQDVLQLLRFCVSRGTFVRAVVELPAAAGIGVSEVWDLAQLCCEKLPVARYDDSSSSDDEIEPTAPLYMLELVAALPAARRLTSEQVLQLLQQALQTPSDIQSHTLSSVLKLPAARHISPAGAETLVQAALSTAASKSWVLEDLCSHIPACAAAYEAVSSPQLQQQLQAVLAEHESCRVSVATLLQHPKLQHHIEEVMPTVLLAAFHTRTKQPARASLWCRSPGGEGYQGMKLRLNNQELQQLLQLPAARGLSSKVIAELMGLSVERMGGELLQELVRLPAAAEVGHEVVHGLLQQAAGHASTATTDPGLTDASAASWSDLVLECLAARSGPAVLFPLLQLPWAQLLPASTIRALLQETMERQARPAFDRLMQLPQAPLGAADMQLYADALQASARDGREELLPNKRTCSEEESEDDGGGYGYGDFDGYDEEGLFSGSDDEGSYYTEEEPQGVYDDDSDDDSEQGSDGGYSY